MRKVHVVLILAICLSLFSFSSASSVSLYEITFINVGQGDAALLQDPNGFTVLIDGGRAGAGPTVVSFIRSQGVSQIDVMLATHPDADHIGGLIDALEMTDVPVKSVVTNGYPGDTQTWTNFVNAVSAEGLSLTTVLYPQSLSWGMMQAQVLNPEGGLTNPDTNEACLVVKVTMGSIKSLFTCDLDSEQEGDILERPVDVNSDILKVAHHGSNYGSSMPFLNAVTPSIAVISVGPNAYDHPGAETLARLEDAGAGIWRTDQDGNVTVLTDGVTFTVNAPFVDISRVSVYLPLVQQVVQVITTQPPTATIPPPTQVTPTATTPSPTPVTPTATTPAPGNVVITSIFYNGAGSGEPDEYLELQNQGGSAVQLQGWTLRDNASNPHVFAFPSFLMQPGQVCRVYTNEIHPESCGFSYGNGTAVWNNTGDCAYLRDGQGSLVDEYCY